MNKKAIILSIMLGVLLAGCGNQNSLKPVIGIAAAYKNAANSVSDSYVEAVEHNGGIPVILPTIENEQAIDAYVYMLDGLVLIGGDDIPPAAYGQTAHPTTKLIDEKRYNFENKLIQLWFESDKPMLGICLGMQFANVVSGGTLIQDIPSQTTSAVDHRCKDKLHAVYIDPSSRLAKILNATRANVYSNHHQAADKIGRNLKPAAHSEDGLIEALERTDGQFGLFVQWHPEVMTDNHRNAVFSAFIRECAK